MIDRNKILEDFEYAVRKSHGEGWDYVDGLTTEDGFKILQLLKEQEPVKPEINEDGKAFCGNCGENVGIFGQTMNVVVRVNYCPECGRKVKWEYHRNRNGEGVKGQFK